MNQSERHFLKKLGGIHKVCTQLGGEGQLKAFKCVQEGRGGGPKITFYLLLVRALWMPPNAKRHSLEGFRGTLRYCGFFLESLILYQERSAVYLS